MTLNRYSWVLGFFVASGMLGACSSKSSDDSASGGASGGNSSVSLGNTGGGGVTSVGSFPSPGDTEFGTLSITKDAADKLLEDANTVCQGWVSEAEAEASVIEFLVDVSGSMNDAAPSTGGLSKWEVTKTALKAAIQKLPASYGVGVSFYPNMAVSTGTNARPTTACVDSTSDVPIAVADATQQAKILAAIDAVVPNERGATPTHDAFDIAVQNMKNTTLPGRRYIAFITDGQPTQSQGCIGTGATCQTPMIPTAPIVAAIASAQSDASIQTFVVGSPGSERSVCTAADLRDWLSAAARAGNTASAGCTDTGPTYCHFDLSTAADFGSALSDALTQITKSLISCDYEVPVPSDSKVIDPAKVNLIYSNGAGDYSLILPNPTADCSKGWNYTDSTNTKVQICGATCELLQNDPAARLSLLFGCATGAIPLQ